MARFTHMVVNVLAPHTKWGDRLFFVNSHHTWDKPFELHTNPATFPWWSVTLPFDAMFCECKCYILRGDEQIWESFEGNRRVGVTEARLAIKFNEKNWICKVCEDDLTTQPVMCEHGHPVHRECFEAYVTTELSRNNPFFVCLECHSEILKDTWFPYTNEATQRRFNKAEKIASGLIFTECPNVSCSYSTSECSGESELDCPQCKVRWCKFCEKELPEGVLHCVICAEGLRTVFQDIYDAIEEAAGTMCPNCKSRGQKYLEECTHITCDCGTLFCYCCGVSKDDVDTADPFSSDINRLYGHNEDWESNVGTRCPMWLSDFGIIYDNWPDDPCKSQKKFHEIKAQKKLVEVKLKTPQMNWERVLELDKSLSMQVEKFLQKRHVEV